MTKIIHLQSPKEIPDGWHHEVVLDDKKGDTRTIEQKIEDLKLKADVVYVFKHRVFYV